MIHIYYGDGKGKTTAAFGLALRSVGANKKVAIIQFLKKGDSSEIKAIKKYKLPIDIFAFGVGSFYNIKDNSKKKTKHHESNIKALKKAQELIESIKYDVIILDEILNTTNYDLSSDDNFFKGIINTGIDSLDVDEIIDQLNLENIKREKKFDIILTGRYLHPKLAKISDLITEMKKHKHYFDKNVKAKKGIEF